MSADITIHSVKQVRVVKVKKMTDLTFSSFVASIEIGTEDCLGNKGTSVITLFADNQEVFNQLSQLLQEQKQQEEQERLIAAAEL